MQLVFAAAGAGIASSIAPAGWLLFGVKGLTAGAVGWTAGSVIGGMLFPPGARDISQTGPRLDDLSVKISSYGQPLPLLYGTLRVPGTLIWTSGLVEASQTSTQESGGKGGGGGSVTTTTYSYAASFAVALCEGPIQGVRRIWADSKLIYDVGTGASLASIMASSDKAAAIRVYLGSETQTADPLIQSYEGAANVPAFRGTAYLVFDTLQLADFGNRLPTITCEVVASSSVAYSTKLQANFQTFPAYPPNFGWSDNTDPSGVSRSIFSVHDVSAASVAGFNGGTLRDGVYEEIYCIGDYGVHPSVTNWRRRRYTAEGQFHDTALDWNPTFDDYDAGIGAGSFYFPRFHCTDERATVLLCRQRASPNTDLVEYFNWDRRKRGKVAANVALAGDAGYGPSAISQKNGQVYISVYCAGAAPSKSPSAAVGDVNVYRFTPDVTDPTLVYNWSKAGVGVALSDDPYSAVIVTDNYWWLALTYKRSGDSFYTEEFKRFPLGSGTPDQQWTSLGTDNNNKVFKSAPTGGRGWWIVDEEACIFRAHRSGDGKITEFVNGTITEIGTSTSAETPQFHDAWGANGEIVVTSNNASGAPNYVDWLARSLTPGAVTRQSILTALLGKAGLSGSDYDVTAVSGTCRGYMVPRPMPVRQALEPLMAAWFVDAVESDGKIKFVARGGSSAVTFTAADLAARPGGEPPPAPLEVTREEDTDLPIELQVRYFNTDRDYQQGVQYGRRLVSGAIGQASLDLAIVLSDDEARRVADAQLYAAWAGRQRIAWRTGREYAKYEPGDVVTLPQGSDTLTVRITQRDDGANGVIAWQGVEEDASVYTQSSTGAAAQAVDQDIAIAGPTVLELMDIPTLRDQDDGAGYYAAGCGLLSGWLSAQLFVSADAGESYVAEALLTGGALGYATTALGAWNADDNRWDLQNSVTFTLYNDTALASATELSVYNGANVLLVGDEVIQFATAVDNGSRSWTVSKLLRYRKGSEGTQTAAHAIGDRVVVLAGTSATRVSDEIAEINVARSFKAVTAGRTLASAEVETFTDTGNSLKPLSVANVGKARNASNDLLMWWFRRARVAAEWRDLADVALDEDSESYEVDVRNAGDTATLRTLSTSTMPTPASPLSYTAAQQTTDFGAPQGSINVRIYQLSAQVGRGFVRAATL